MPRRPPPSAVAVEPTAADRATAAEAATLAREAADLLAQWYSSPASDHLAITLRSHDRNIFDLRPALDSAHARASFARSGKRVRALAARVGDILGLKSDCVNDVPFEVRITSAQSRPVTAQIHGRSVHAAEAVDIFAGIVMTRRLMAELRADIAAAHPGAPVHGWRIIHHFGTRSAPGMRSGISVTAPTAESAVRLAARTIALTTLLTDTKPSHGRKWCVAEVYRIGEHAQEIIARAMAAEPADSPARLLQVI